MPDTAYQLPSAIPAIAGGGALILWIFFWFGFLITAAFAFGLLYHWLRYGYMYPLAILAIPVYSIGVLVLLGAMLTGIGTI
jgi:hypothetical protein